MTARRLGLVAGAALAIAARAHAHDRSVSYSTWRLAGRHAQVTLRLTRLEATHLPWAASLDDAATARLARYAAQHLRLHAGDAPCPPDAPPRALPAPEAWVALAWDVSCPPDGALRIESDLLREVAPAHLHFARVERDAGAPTERVLVEAAPAWTLDEPTGAGGESLLGYLRLGIEHILSGWDHLAFLFALLLVGESVGEVARVVTGFTVGHSATLALAALGWAHPDAPAIEALIGLSIALVAIENVWLASGRGRALPLGVAGALGALAVAAQRGHGVVPAITLAGLALFVACYFGLLRRLDRPRLLRGAVALLFGLVHGFGFAGVLAEARLPADRLVAALFGFNAGVEVGQLAVVTVVWPLLHRLARSAPGRAALVDWGSAAACGVGLFWFVSRAFG